MFSHFYRGFYRFPCNRHWMLLRKQNSPAQVSDGRLQGALGTVKAARVGSGGSLGLGSILCNVEFQPPREERKQEEKLVIRFSF